MAEASRVLASSMDYSENTAAVARPSRAADRGLVRGGCRKNDRGEIDSVAAHHIDPEQKNWRRPSGSIAATRPTLDDRSGSPRLIRSGHAQMFTDIQPDALAAYARMTSTSSCSVRSARGGDHRADGRSGQDDRGNQPWSPRIRSAVSPEADLALAVRLGRRAGTPSKTPVSIRSAHGIAHVLQRALLPESLPEVPGVESSRCTPRPAS